MAWILSTIQCKLNAFNKAVGPSSPCAKHPRRFHVMASSLVMLKVSRSRLFERHRSLQAYGTCQLPPSVLDVVLTHGRVHVPQVTT